MNSHDVGRGRGSVAQALASIRAKSLVVGIDSDRLFPIEGQAFIAEHIGGELVGGELRVISSAFGHDGFLIEHEIMSSLIAELLAS
jgi:homoserine O-acetyltransferase